jgi:hypothetical protein
MDRRRTDKWQLLDARLRERAGVDLDTYVEQRRTADVSWLDIAFEVREKTGRKVSPASLLVWYKEDSPKVAAAS